MTSDVFKFEAYAQANVEGHSPVRCHVASDIESAVEAPLVLHARVVNRTGGGPDKTILRSPAYFDPARFRAIAAYLYPRGDAGIHVLAERARKQACPFYRIAERGALDMQAIRQLIHLCRRKNVCIWHGHDYKTDALGLLVRRYHPMKLVTTVHGFTRETWRTRLYYHVDNLAMRHYDRVIAVSPPLVEHCKQHGVTEDRLVYIPNGIELDPSRKRRPRAKARRLLDIGGDAQMLIVVSRFSSEKGVDRAVRLLAELSLTMPRLELHLV
ncbi:MAG: glycosyltransferase, partial [Rhodospirillales bacterium]|nr:glycosyltransferase [Rhodospirillales bacterium]